MRGGCGRGYGGIPLPLHKDFAFLGLKVNDLVHTVGDFVGINYGLSKINRKTNTSS